MRYWLVMPAAGAGRRFGSPKQYAPLAGSTVLEVALQPFLRDERCVGGALVLAADDPQRERLSAQLAGRLHVVGGGAERVHSVHQGLAALVDHARAEDWVLVHDAARPCLSASDLTRLLEEGAADPVGALLAVPLADTLKRAGESAGELNAIAGFGAASAVGAVGVRISQTLAREGLWQAQTPQMFRFAALRAALEAALAERRTPTDEAQAMEWRGLHARLVASRDGNPKITGGSDLLLAEAILTLRSKRECG